MHPDKIIPTVLGPNDISDDNLSYLIVRDFKWNLIECPIQLRLKRVKYLGIQLDHRRDYAASAELVLQAASQRLSHLLAQPGNP